MRFFLFGDFCVILVERLYIIVLTCDRVATDVLHLWPQILSPFGKLWSEQWCERRIVIIRVGNGIVIEKGGLIFIFEQPFL